MSFPKPLLTFAAFCNHVLASLPHSPDVPAAAPQYFSKPVVFHWVTVLFT